LPLLVGLFQALREEVKMMVTVLRVKLQATGVRQRAAFQKWGRDVHELGMTLWRANAR
jgi:hypothetical protein